MDVVNQLARRRADTDQSLRDLARGTGASLSSLTGLENGSAWPAWTSLARYAAAVNAALAIPGDEDVPVPVALRSKMPRKQRHSAMAYARRIEVRPATLYDAFREGGTPNSRVVFYLATALDCPITVIDADPSALS